MQRKRVLCFGDSLTWGFDPESRERFPEESRWPVVLQQELGDSFQVIEEGQCGRTIATEDPAEGEKNGLTYIRPCLETHSPLDLVIIMLGSNDCKQKFSYSSMDIAGEMQIFLEKVISYNHFRCDDRFRILLVSPPVITDSIRGSWLGDAFGADHSQKVSSELALWYLKLSKIYHCSYLDASTCVTTSQADGCHLDADAQKKLGLRIAEKIKEERLA